MLCAFDFDGTLADSKLAKNAGIFALGVPWGYHDEPTLLAHGADAIAPSVSRVRDIIRRALG